MRRWEFGGDKWCDEGRACGGCIACGGKTVICFRRERAND